MDFYRASAGFSGSHHHLLFLDLLLPYVAPRLRFDGSDLAFTKFCWTSGCDGALTILHVLNTCHSLAAVLLSAAL